jgi:hypothetical protein
MTQHLQEVKKIVSWNQMKRLHSAIICKVYFQRHYLCSSQIAETSTEETLDKAEQHPVPSPINSRDPLIQCSRFNQGAITNYQSNTQRVMQFVMCHHTKSYAVDSSIIHSVTLSVSDLSELEPSKNWKWQNELRIFMSCFNDNWYRAHIWNHATKTMVTAENKFWCTRWPKNNQSLTPAARARHFDPSKFAKRGFYLQNPSKFA